jgi:hypothetical protein
MATLHDIGSNQDGELKAFGTEAVGEAEQPGLEEFEQRDQERTETEAAAPILEKLALAFQYWARIVLKRQVGQSVGMQDASLEPTMPGVHLTCHFANSLSNGGGLHFASDTGLKDDLVPAAIPQPEAIEIFGYVMEFAEEVGDKLLRDGNR